MNKCRYGAAAVEFAVVAPIFIALLMGVLEYGRAVQVKQVLTNASREGARVLTLQESTVETAREKVVVYLNSGGYDGSAAVIIPTIEGELARVNVTMPFARVSWMPPFVITQVTAETVMRRETIQ